MKILLLGFSALKPGFEQLGHEVVTCCTTDESSDIWFSEFPIDVDRIFERLSPGWEPDFILLTDESTEPMFLGLERLDIPLGWYVFDSHLHLHWHQAYSAVFDFVFVAQKSNVSNYEWDCTRQVVTWLPLFCNPERDRCGTLPKIYDLSFVGSLNSQYKPARNNLLKAIGEHIPIYITSGEYVTVYNRSKVVLNECAANDVNFRIFEALACGSFLLTERVGNGFEDLFQDGEHLVTYDKSELDRLVDLVKYYVSHTTERERIAHCGRDLVLRFHTTRHRAKTILETIAESDVQSHVLMRQARQDEILDSLTVVYDHAAAVYSLASQRYQDSSVQWRHCVRAKEVFMESSLRSRRQLNRTVSAVSG